ncbi:MAG: SUMF1/EgtB/PvdO family nonheme iron enzyme [Pleurocapsa minor GSE-CHR-MK-17-07R]|jgi:formylglycine-generating enzyme required for sulfatase activity|nr:SUMF1/EgtB/PvdO family nonheme iron enzyme [Pleurocapsa minor GSE-CHR-MK 17-07R]
MRLFISYLREEKAYCVQVAELLGSAHEIWYDSRLHAGQQWWEEIVRSLEWCEGFIYLISKESVKSPNCINELALALEQDKHIFPVLITEDAEIPATIAHLHCADMREGITPGGIAQLLNDIHTAEIADLTRVVPAVSRTPSAAANARQMKNATHEVDALTLDPGEPVDAHNIDAIVERATSALRAENFDEAHDLIQRTIESGLNPRYIDLEQLLSEAKAGREENARRANVTREYAAIAHLVKLGRTHAYGCTAYASFVADNPNFPDEQHLRSLCGIDPLPSAQVVTAQAASAPAPDVSLTTAAEPFSLPLLAWCEIPAGGLPVIVERNGKPDRDVLSVPAFKISKYPVTQAQFAAFIIDPDGYSNPDWWDFSDAARASRRAKTRPKAVRFEGDDHPRENVDWFEAMAFCRWLSARTGKQITLPLRQQWIRAARGDDDRLYPWGKEFSAEFANTDDSRIMRTTPVTRYEDGSSPFGVVDMAGNCWEYCLNLQFENTSIASDGMRALQGGSYLSRSVQAQIGVFISLAPHTAHHNIGFRLVMLD